MISGSLRIRILRSSLIVAAGACGLGLFLQRSVSSPAGLWLGGLAIVAVAAGVLHWTLGWHLGGFDDLLGAAQRMASGDTETRAPSSDSDVGRLGRYLNVLADAQRVSVHNAEGSRRKLEDLLASLPLEIALFDRRGAYLYEKPAECAPEADSRLALGMRPSELYRLRGEEPIGREIDDAIKQCLETGEAVRLQQRTCESVGGREFIRVYSPVEADRSDAVRVVGYGLDVTEQRRAESQLRERDEELRQAKQLETTGRLAGGVAHDFDELVTSILKSVELATGEDDLPEQAKERLEAIRAHAVEARVLTGQLLAFGRQQVLRPEVLDVTVIVREAEMMVRRVLGRHIRVESSHVDAAVNVDVDPTKLEQALMRLAMNARNAMSDGGCLTIRTDVERIERRPARAVGPFHAGTYAVITVGDTGAGIDEADLDRIFEPFFTSEAGDGRGLGLSVVEGTVSQSGGFIAVESKVGVGTTFRVFLPCVETPAVATNTEPATATHTSNGRVALVAATHDSLRTFSVDSLRSLGFEVYEAQDGSETIEWMRNAEGAVDLLVIDVAIEGVGAPDAVRVISSFRPDVHVIPVARSTKEALAHQATLGSVLHLSEPYESALLKRAVRHLADRPAPQTRARTT